MKYANLKEATKHMDGSDYDVLYDTLSHLLEEPEFIYSKLFPNELRLQLTILSEYFDAQGFDNTDSHEETYEFISSIYEFMLGGDIPIQTHTKSDTLFIMLILYFIKYKGYAPTVSIVELLQEVIERYDISF